MRGFYAQIETSQKIQSRSIRLALRNQSIYFFALAFEFHYTQTTSTGRGDLSCQFEPYSNQYKPYTFLNTRRFPPQWHDNDPAKKPHFSFFCGGRTSVFHPPDLAIISQKDIFYIIRPGLSNKRFRL